MKYSIAMISGRTRLRHRDCELGSDHEARIEAVAFAADVLRSEGADQQRDLTVEVRGPANEIRVTIDIRSHTHARIEVADEEQFHEGGAHPT